MAATNYDDVVAQLREAGLTGRDVETLRVGTPRPVRCPIEGDREKRGWYWLHELNTHGGDLLIVGTFGVWRGNDQGTQKVDLRKREISKEQSEALRQRLREERKHLERERRRIQERAAQHATALWAKLPACEEHEYLARKSVLPVDAKVSPKSGALVIPLTDTAGRVHGLQLIRTAKQAAEAKRPTKEFFPAGLAKTGHFHMLGAPRPGEPVLVAEGYATALTLNQPRRAPVVVAFDANNLKAVGEALRKRYPQSPLVFCADDDRFAKCIGCDARLVLTQHPTDCPACGKPHGKTNTGVTYAEAAALALNGTWFKPEFPDEAAEDALFLQHGTKHTDFNDLQIAAGLPTVRRQLEDHLRRNGLDRPAQRAHNTTTGEGGGGAGERPAKLKPIQSMDELLKRFALVYGQGGIVFDRQEHKMVTLGDMRDACVRRELHRAWTECPDRQIVRVSDVVFEPSLAEDPDVCNLWAGWPTTAKAGKCDRLLELLRHMCKDERDSESLFQWVLRWVAYPLQHPGAKMKSTVVIHSKQGTGKNLFWETIMGIYGEYGRMVDQAALESQFNAWASRKLFLVADEVLARSEIYHVKNKLKSFITGEWIRINPKGNAEWDERNHVNLVFLSNEAMPVALEDDDRRHAVIWIPENLPAEFYAAVAAEIEAGGREALHHHLLHLDLGDFDEHTKPPMTDAKRELIELGMDSTSRFYHALWAGEVRRGNTDVPCGPALSEDVYEVYRLWCARNGYRNIAPINKLVNALKRRHGVRGERKRYLLGQSTYGPHQVLMFGDLEPEPGATESHWLGAWIQRFRDAMETYREAGRP